MKIGLRVDVDTFRGTRDGVPNLCRIMDKHGISAAFFFSVGPDNMGRHMWRLLKPQFLWKMMRTKAASLYGWDIIFMGTMWPGFKIGKNLAYVIKDCAKAGHEIGVHAWDHHAWQSKIDSMDQEAVYEHIKRAFDELERITGHFPTCSAVPGWKCVESTLLVKEKLPFKYNSDCRGNSVFMPVVDGTVLSQPQVPLNMPTYDEMLGRNGVTNENYNECLLKTVNPNGMNLLTIHAEAEGGACMKMFDEFLSMAKAQGITFCPPGELIPSDLSAIPHGKIAKGEIPGREGWVAVQTNA